jgi:hypothetical protein
MQEGMARLMTIINREKPRAFQRKQDSDGWP